jgi:hypothetical protein
VCSYPACHTTWNAWIDGGDEVIHHEKAMLNNNNKK